MTGQMLRKRLQPPTGTVPPDWRVARLKDITIKIGSGATPRGGQRVYLSARENFALVRSQNVFDRYFSTDGLAFISDEHASQLESVWLEPGDLLLNITGDGITFGRACLVPEEVLPACVNQHVAIVRPNPELCSPGYILSYLTHPLIKKYIESFNAGGSRRAITKGHIESFVIPLPPLGEQRAIVSLLQTLDDKIELNRQMNRTLEAIARAIFKSWFVDFDPVWAKLALSEAEGMDGEQPYGMDAETAALFPDSFTDSPFGQIPQGWQVGTLRDCCERVENGGTPKRSEPKYWEPGAIPWLTSGEVRQSIVISTANLISEEGLTHSSAKLWPSGTTVVAMYGATAGQVCLLAKRMCANQACCGLVPTENAQFYIYLHVSRSVELLERQARGSAQQNLSQKIVASFPAIIPSPAILTSFHKTCRPLFKKWVANLHESRTLAELRDTLLPRLISGQLRVPDAERFVQKPGF